MKQVIAILDFGSQYTQVIARRVRECHVYSRVYPYSVKVDQLVKDGVCGVIFSGGPASVYQPQAPRPDEKIFNLGVPILGICYGLQLQAAMLGGDVQPGMEREYGYGVLEVRSPSPLFEGLPKQVRVWNSHGDRVVRLPEGFSSIGVTENAPYAVVADEKKKFYGVQFHPEVAHTEYGKELLENFLFRICACRGDWVMSDFIEQSVQTIRARVGQDRVVLGISGGVDSTVVAALIHRAIGKQLTCIFVDNGLLRLNEALQVQESYRGLGWNVQCVDASAQFLSALSGVSEPEQKRKIIGATFIQVFEASLEKYAQGAKFLAQGTLYSDVIESATADGHPAAVIKSHHNVGGLPARMKLDLLEPVRELFKDEVRELGRLLGIPETLIKRHPFPGPGLAVRILGEITPNALELVRRADVILVDEMKRSGWYDKVWQAFCVFLPIRSVGVMGDERTYDHVVALRIVESIDAMTANWAHVPYELLGRVSSRIINEVKGINRVVYDISSKPPSTIEWE